MVLLDTGTPGTSRENSEDADDGTRTHNPSVINFSDEPQLRNDKYMETH